MKTKADAGGDRLPPFSLEAEQGVLGCVLLAPGECMNFCEEAGVRHEWFYDLRHASIYHVLQGMQAKGAPIDLITVMQKLKDGNLLEQVGSIGYLSDLPNMVPSAANLEYYLEIVREKWLLRRMLTLCTEVGTRVLEHEGEVSQLFDEVERDILKISEARLDDRERSVKEVLVNVVNDLEDYHRGRAQIRGITTGLEYLDKLVGGFGGKNGNYIVLSARPGMGKTALAMDIVLHACLDYEHFEPALADGKPVMEMVEGEERPKMRKKRGVPAAVFSLEMTSEALVQRMLFQRARADMQRWRSGFAVAADFPPLTQAASDIAKAKLWIDDEGRCTIETLKAKARRLHRQHGIRLFVIDYIQLMKSGGKRFRDDRVQELAEISAEIQNLSKELNVPIIVLAQMNRDYEKDPNRVPRLADLKDCGSIEQDADMVGFLYGPKMKDGAQERYDAAMEAEFGDDWSKYPQRVNIIWAKNRYGPMGICEMLFQKSCTHFLDYNVWLKEHGYKDAAAGESQYARASGGRELPTNEEMRLNGSDE